MSLELAVNIFADVDAEVVSLEFVTRLRLMLLTDEMLCTDTLRRFNIFLSTSIELSRE